MSQPDEDRDFARQLFAGPTDDDDQGEAPTPPAGNYVPREGTFPARPSNEDEREVARALFSA